MSEKIKKPAARVAKKPAAKPARKPTLAKAKPAKPASPKAQAAKRPMAKPQAAKSPAAKPQPVKLPAPKPISTKALAERLALARPVLVKAPLTKPDPSKPALVKPTAPMRPALPGKPILVKLPVKDSDLGIKKHDFVVYPAHGVGKVLGIETQEISGHSLQVIIIHFEKDRMTLRVPVAKARNSGLRKLSTRKVMDNAMQTLKGRSRIKRAMWSRRAQEYEAKINSGDPVSIAEVVRDLHRNADQPDQSYSERQIYQAALDRLVRELAAIDGIDEEQATARLHSVLKTAA